MNNRASASQRVATASLPSPNAAVRAVSNKNKNPDEVYVVVVGDEGVGKTSLVAAAANETWCEAVPSILPPAKMQQPGGGNRSGFSGTGDAGMESTGSNSLNRGAIDKSVTSCVILVDTLADAIPATSTVDPTINDGTDDNMPDSSSSSSIWVALRSADAVIVCYSSPVAKTELQQASRASSETESNSHTANEVDESGYIYGGIKRLKSVWLPLVKKLAPNVPIILTGTQMDVVLGEIISQETLFSKIESKNIGDGWDDEESIENVGGMKSRQAAAMDHLEKTFQEHIAIPLLDEFREIETCLECSSKTLHQVYDVFHYAHKAVVHPSAPLIDLEKRSLRQPAIKALSHVFLSFDRDEDNCLSDEELNAFQVTCFNAPLHDEEITAIKRVVGERMPRGICIQRYSKVDGKSRHFFKDSPSESPSHQDDSTIGEVELINLSGFLFLHSLFLERGRMDITWTVLRKFGYTNSLVLREDLQCLQVPKRLHLDQVYELSEDAISFLKHTFKRYDRDGDETLTPLELSELFFTSPCVPWEGKSWEGAVETGMFGSYSSTKEICGKPARLSGLTWKGFLAQWSLMAMQSPRTTLESLYYLGYHGILGDMRGRSKGVVLSQRRRDERRKGVVERSTLVCWVIGSQGAGKSEIMQGLAGRAFGSIVPRENTETKDTVENSSRHSSTERKEVVHSGDFVSSKSESVKAKSSSFYDTVWSADILEYENHARTLCMREIPHHEAFDLLKNEAELMMCDVIMFVFDSSSDESFDFMTTAISLLEEQNLDIPIIILAAKDDIMHSRDSQKIPKQVSMRPLFYANHDIALVLPVSMKTGDTSSAYLSTVMVAMHPELAIPETIKQREIKQYKNVVRRAIVYTVGSIALILGTSMLWRYLSSSSSNSSPTSSSSSSSSSSPSSSSSSENS